MIQPVLTLAFVKLGAVSLLNGSFIIQPWRLYMFTTSLLPIVCFVVIRNLSESPEYLFSQGKYIETLDVLKTMHNVNYRQSNMHKVILRVYL